MDTLVALCAALTEPGITVARLSEMIGAPQPRAGSRSPWEVKPRDSGFAAAEVVGDGEDTPPAYLRLTIADSAHLTVDTLRHAFGDANKLPRSRPAQGDSWMFRLKPEGARFTCAVIAETEAAGSERVRTLTLRRDRALT